jgi:hypothetical protein
MNDGKRRSPDEIIAMVEEIYVALEERADDLEGGTRPLFLAMTDEKYPRAEELAQHVLEAAEHLREAAKIGRDDHLPHVRKYLQRLTR